jgi:hypothetical protein
MQLNIIYDIIYDSMYAITLGEPMSGIKKTTAEKKIRVMIGFSGASLKRLDKQARKEGRGRSQLVRRAVSRYLDMEELKTSN